MPFKHNWHCENSQRSRKVGALAEISGFRPMFVFPRDGYYVGNWSKGKRYGFGAKHQRNGLTYDGEWEDDKRSGVGAVRKITSNGSSLRIFIGQWKDNMKHGEGKKFYNNGTYLGTWKKDKRSGPGIMWFKNGAIYLGEWEDDLYNGSGVLFETSGNRYEGFFNNGRKNGEGIYYHMKTGQIQKGMWEDGICRTSIMFDDFRNNALNPTNYPIPKSGLRDSNKVVHDLFRNYLPKIVQDVDSLEGISCLQLMKKIKSKFRNPED